MTDTTLYRQTFEKGATVFNEGECGDVAYIIEKGAIEISTVDHDERIVLGILTNGHILGEMAMIDEAPRTATATAVEDTVLTVVGRKQLQERIEHAEPILRMLVNVIMARYRSGLDKVKGTPLADHLNAPLPSSVMDGEATAISKIRLENELRQALDSGELEVFFQPITNLETGKWAGVEALTRWHHLHRGAVSPLQFISLAEETSLIIPIGLFVLEQACRDLLFMQEQRDKVDPDEAPLFVGVNVSGRQLDDPDFIDQIADVVRRVGIPPASLKLEITESLTMNYHAVIKWVRRCKAKGFTVAIDDFGTGYSSLEHLLELDVDNLKIDQTFIRAMLNNPRALELIRGIIALARGLGLSIIAEGIETEAQMQTLADLGCEYGQGYFIGKPQSLEDAKACLESGC